MKSLLNYCKECNLYTLYPICPTCHNHTENPTPPRFSPEDKYGKYRRLLRKDAKKND